MPDIRFDNLSKRFGDTVVFDGFSAVLQGGGFYVLSEPSGSGKTTLLRLLAGLEKPDSGSISGVPAQIGMVFQEDRLLDALTLRKNIELVLPADRRDAALIRSHLTEIGIADSMEKPAGELSGGMKRRAAIVRALLHPCGLLLLDEPFTGLDREALTLTARYIMTHRGGRTLVLASHIQTAEFAPDGVRIHNLCF